MSSYREKDYRAENDDLRDELEVAKRRINDLSDAKRWRVVQLLQTIELWHIGVLIGIPVVGVTTYFIWKLPPAPAHEHVLAADGHDALRNHCRKREDCYAEAKNECRAGYDVLNFQDKHGTAIQCLPICTSDGKNMTCIQSCNTYPTYDAWLTYRCKPEAIQ